VARWMKRALAAAALAGAVLLLGAAGAGAQEPEPGLASGKEADMGTARGSPAVQANACGNAVGVAGDASASCDGTQEADTSGPSDGGAVAGSTEDGIASGNVVEADAVQGSPAVQANACGNAVGVAGDASASCDGTQEADTSGPGGTPAEEPKVPEPGEPEPENPGSGDRPGDTPREGRDPNEGRTGRDRPGDTPGVSPPGGNAPPLADQPVLGDRSERGVLPRHLRLGAAGVVAAPGSTTTEAVTARPGDTLAVTGSDIRWMLVLLILLLVGGAITLRRGTEVRTFAPDRTRR
jgi:hypothetical protein